MSPNKSKIRDCPIEKCVNDELAFGYYFDKHDQFKKIKCISKHNHIKCFEKHFNELKSLDSRIFGHILDSAIWSEDLNFLRYLDNKYSLKDRSDTIKNDVNTMELVKYFREEIGHKFDKEFIYNCKDYDILKYALENGCEYVGWKLKFHLDKFKIEMENDQWMKDLYDTLNYH